MKFQVQGKKKISDLHLPPGVEINYDSPKNTMSELLKEDILRMNFKMTMTNDSGTKFQRIQIKMERKL